jgi:palmitoyltransferase
MDTQQLARLAVPAVVVLVAFLSYSSQYLFSRIGPGPLTSKEKVIFNAFVACIWISYTRACRTDPGGVPSGWEPEESPKSQQSPLGRKAGSRQRYCRKCEAVKPPRSHPCRVCRRYAATCVLAFDADRVRCIPKMDHHCPWTVNCVSHFTFPHFMRFLWYAVSSMCYLEYFLYVRASAIWEDRNMPSVS